MAELKANTCNRRQAWENTCKQVTIGFGFGSHLLKKWRDFCQPITDRSNAKLMQTNYFQRALKAAQYLQLIMLHFLSMALTHTSAIPHFKEVIIMATTCDSCGHRTNEVKSGGKLLNFLCDLLRWHVTVSAVAGRVSLS